MYVCVCVGKDMYKRAVTSVRTVKRYVQVPLKRSTLNLFYSYRCHIQVTYDIVLVDETNEWVNYKLELLEGSLSLRE